MHEVFGYLDNSDIPYFTIKSNVGTDLAKALSVSLVHFAYILQLLCTCCKNAKKELDLNTISDVY